MSYVDDYSRRPRYSTVGYGGQNSRRDYGQTYSRNYGQNYGNGYDPNYRHYNYQQPVTYAPRRRDSYNSHNSHHSHNSRNSRNSYPASQVVYSSGTPRYVIGGRDYHQSHHGHSTHAPNIVVASSRDLGHQMTSYVSTGTSNRYRAEGHRGQAIPVVAGVSYRDEYIPLSTRIRRLFGLGPWRSSTHIGKCVHVKRWGFGPQEHHSTQHYTTADYGRHGSQSTVYTL